MNLSTAAAKPSSALEVVTRRAARVHEHPAVEGGDGGGDAEGFDEHRHAARRAWARRPIAQPVALSGVEKPSVTHSLEAHDSPRLG